MREEKRCMNRATVALKPNSGQTFRAGPQSGTDFGTDPNNTQTSFRNKAMKQQFMFGLPRKACNDNLLCKSLWLLTFSLGLQACTKAPEPAVSAAQPAAHAAATSSIAWVKPDGANMDPIFAQAKAANK